MASEVGVTNPPTTAVHATGEPTIDQRVSVVIPCHASERWPYLVEAVASVQAQTPRPVAIVVAVDNNPALFDRAKRELRDVTVVANTFARGAAGTRNTGVMHTTTPFVALLDDDARARPGWLAALIEPFEDPKVVGTGGRVCANWEGGRPNWFPRELLWAVGVSHQRMATSRVTLTRNVWALSMAVRRNVFEEVDGFQENFTKIGRRSKPEDTDLCLRMAHVSGGAWAYVTDAVVDHHVPHQRATLGYVLVRSYEEGRGKVGVARRQGGFADLDLERQYLIAIAPRAVLVGILDTLRGHGLGGLARAGVMVCCVAAAGIGALVEALHPAARPAHGGDA